jgi:hypothetical protein
MCVKNVSVRLDYSFWGQLSLHLEILPKENFESNKLKKGGEMGGGVKIRIILLSIAIILLFCR